MAQGIWGDVMSAASSVPIAGALPAAARGITQAIQGKNPATSFSEMIPGYGSFEAGSQIAGGPTANTGVKAIQNATSSPGLPADTAGMEKWISGLTEGQANNPQQAQADATKIASYIKGLPIGQAEAAMKALEGQKGGIQGTQIATDLYNALNGTASTTGAGAGQGQAGFDPLGLSQAFSTVIPQWLSKQAGETQATNQAGEAQMQQALQGASPAIQAAYKATMPAMENAENAETANMANLAVTTPMFNDIVSGIQAMNTAYGAAKQYAMAEPYTQATVQGTPLPGGATNANSLTAGLQGPGIPAAGATPTGTGTTTPGTTASGAFGVNPNAALNYYLQLYQNAQSGQAGA